MQQLELVREAKIFDILPGSPDPRLEASGVLALDGLFYVIFDNLPHIACISPELSRAAGRNHLIMQERGHRSGFEDLAHDSLSGRFYVLIESLPAAAARSWPRCRSTTRTSALREPPGWISRSTGRTRAWRA
jgi:hypothetical protein